MLYCIKFRNISLCANLLFTTCMSVAPVLAFTGSTTMNVSLTISSDCSLTADPMAFGIQNYSAFPSGITATAHISVTCTGGIAYTVDLDKGQNVASGLRYVKYGSDTIQYELYKDAAYINIWGDNTGGTVHQSATGTGFAQVYTVYGKIVPLNVSSKPPGPYTDTVTVTLSY